MSIKNFIVTYDDYSGVTYLRCERCADAGTVQYPDDCSIEGFQLHRILSMAFAHDARVHKEEK